VETFLNKSLKDLDFFLSSGLLPLEMFNFLPTMMNDKKKKGRERDFFRRKVFFGVKSDLEQSKIEVVFYDLRQSKI
jgi:hypothetical protein